MEEATVVQGGVMRGDRRCAVVDWLAMADRVDMGVAQVEAAARAGAGVILVVTVRMADLVALEDEAEPQGGMEEEGGRSDGAADPLALEVAKELAAKRAAGVR